MNKWKMSLGSSRGKKIWIRAYKKIGDIKDNNGLTIGNMKQLASIELNIIDNINKVVWVIEDAGKETDIKLSEAEELELIQLALNFAKEKGYINKILKRNSKLKVV